MMKLSFFSTLSGTSSRSTVKGRGSVFFSSESAMRVNALTTCGTSTS